MLQILFALLVSVQPHGTVQIDSLWSQSLGGQKYYEVYLPPSYGLDTTRRYPVAYYLHGLYGNERNWVELGHLDHVMDSLTALGSPEMIVVMPDGDDGWYTTWTELDDYSTCIRDTLRTESAATYCVRRPHYDDYIAHDLVPHVDSAYRTIGDRPHRAIAGLSMGGYGAVALALQYPGAWSAAASHSGVLSPTYVGPRPFAGSPTYATTFAQIEAQWGAEQNRGYRWISRARAFGRDISGWRSRDPAWRLRQRLAARPTTDSPSHDSPTSNSPIPALFMDVGRDDGLADETRAFHAELTRLGIPHEYAEWPGTHNWDYWRAHVGQSLAWIASLISEPSPPGSSLQ